MSNKQGNVIGCNHLAVSVDELEQAKQFYSEVLMLEELERPEFVAKSFSSAWYSLGNCELHVVEDKNMVQSGSPAGPHFAISTDNFAAFSASVAKADITIIFGPGKGLDDIERLVVKDPAGNVIEIIDLPLRG
jgi:catechol 2,3-dioxygenase-like lactoylglutathione lyase family enzyme